MLHKWRPGIFLGVLLDPSGHKVGASRPELGPDFCLILDFHMEAGTPGREEYLESPEFTALRKRLGQDSGLWSFVDQLHDRRGNPWHPLHLRRPLVEVMHGTNCFEGQVDRYEATAREALELLLAGGELTGLRDRLVAKGR